MIAGRNAEFRFLRALIGGRCGLFRVEQVEAEEKQSGGVWVSFDNVLCAVSCVVVRVCVFVSEKQSKKGRECASGFVSA